MSVDFCHDAVLDEEIHAVLEVVPEAWGRLAFPGGVIVGCCRRVGPRLTTPDAAQPVILFPILPKWGTEIDEQILGGRISQIDFDSAVLEREHGTLTRLAVSRLVHSSDSP